MSLTTRVVAAVTVLSLAAIPVAALTIKNTSTQDVSIAVDNGVDERVYQVPAGGSVDVKEDCSSDCAVTGPWGYSRLVAQNATIETDGGSLVTADAAPASPSLVPQNPVAEPADGADVSAAETPPPVAAKPPVRAKKPVHASSRKRSVKSSKAAMKHAKKKGPGAGSFQMLFVGPGK